MNKLNTNAGGGVVKALPLPYEPPKGPTSINNPQSPGLHGTNHGMCGTQHGPDNNSGMGKPKAGWPWKG